VGGAGIPVFEGDHLNDGFSGTGVQTGGEVDRAGLLAREHWNTILDGQIGDVRIVDRPVGLRREIMPSGIEELERLGLANE